MAAVYDTAEPKNQAHAEIFQTEHVIDDADKLELKFELFTKFSNGHLTKPDSYRGGDLALRLNSNHQSQIA